MHAYDAHELPYFISSSGVMQLREACYTVVSYAPYILLQMYTITILSTFRVTIFEFYHPGPPGLISTGKVFLKHFSSYEQLKFVVELSPALLKR